MKRNKQIDFAVLILVLLASCSAPIRNDIAVFRRDIPVSKYGEPDLFYSLAQQKAKQLKLDSLQNGFDSLQIRIWYDYSLIGLRQLVIIKRAQKAWTATCYMLEVEWDSDMRTEEIKKQTRILLSPKSGWDDFLKQLFGLQTVTLPNMNDIPGLVDGWTDGTTYSVEVATMQQYRFYYYHLPVKFQDKFWQARDMVEILKLVKSELGIEYE
ncbi:MAG: hypothetical protein U0T75_00360 [Chitinophagales bacterium]